MKKLYAIILSLVMMFAFASTAMAADVTVLFTQDCFFADDTGYTWQGYDEEANTLYPGGVVNTDDLVADPSVFDAIMHFNSDEFPITTGWDDDPVVGEPGAYISNVNNTELLSDYGFEDGIYWSSGTGFVVAIEDAAGNITFPEVYVNNVPLVDGMVIYVNLTSYAYTWTD